MWESIAIISALSCPILYLITILYVKFIILIGNKISGLIRNIIIFVLFLFYCVPMLVPIFLSVNVYENYPRTNGESDILNIIILLVIFLAVIFPSLIYIRNNKSELNKLGLYK